MKKIIKTTKIKSIKPSNPIKLNKDKKLRIDKAINFAFEKYAPALKKLASE